MQVGLKWVFSLLLCLACVQVGAYIEAEQYAEAGGEEASPIRQGPRRLIPGECGVGRLAVDATFEDLAGTKLSLSELSREHNAVVIAMTSTSCPLSQKYLPSLVELARKFSSLGVQFVVVNPISTDDKQAMQLAQDAFETHAHYVFDRESALTDAIGAETTTDVIVLDNSRTVVYHGAVDDQYGFGYSRQAPRKTYLSDAIDAILRGRKPEVEATDAPGCQLSVHARPPSNAKVTYHDRIARLMQRHCVACHRDGGVGPFPLDSFEDVAAHAPMIREVIARGIMPPWFAAPEKKDHPSPWANERLLSSSEKDDLLAWIEGDQEEGDVADSPKRLVFEDGWLIGKPDAVFEFDKPIAIKATGIMPYKGRVVTTDLDEDKWIQSIEIRPGVMEVVHHVLVFVEPPLADSEASGRVGIGGIDYWGIYVPGNSTQIYPPGYARKLPKGSRLKFQMHYTPNGTATEDSTRIGMVFAEKEPVYEVKTASIVNQHFKILPGDENCEVTAEEDVQKTTQVLGYLPHHHLRGKACRYELIHADGDVELLLDVPRYDFNWQLFYRYSEPRIFNPGSKIRFTGWYDNSANNPANPDPAIAVGWGEQTEDEMHVGYVEIAEPVEVAPRGDRNEPVERRPGRKFSAIDVDHDGRVSREESRRLGGNTPIPRQDKIFDRFDADKDGSLNRSEYERLLKTL